MSYRVKKIPRGYVVVEENTGEIVRGPFDDRRIAEESLKRVVIEKRPIPRREVE